MIYQLVLCDFKRHLCTYVFEWICVSAHAYLCIVCVYVNWCPYSFAWYLYVFVRNDKHTYAKCVLNALVTRPGQDGTQTKELGAQKEANGNFSVSRPPYM